MTDVGWAGARILMLAPTPTYPMNFGNRRRIWHVARALMTEGAEVHYLHYPAESDWRSDLPAAAQAAMQREWASLFTVPVTRPLHAGPIGTHHGIDEWWDPSIGQTLDWLFATSRFDALVVNYTWLSRAFLHAPRGVLKVLDTHDRFSGRKELLESHGVAPEFFYVTEAEERVALERADIVWAIKGEERDFFAGLAARPIITVPHAEPMRPLPSRATAAVFRFGMVGARNSINFANFKEFLTLARARVERSLLPFELHVAGSCCDDLAGMGWPTWVHFHGRVRSLEAFYRTVDAVLVPMRFSTGLKIRVGEALALGKAVISLRHAFEGYQPCHPFHALEDAGAMLKACEALVAEPARLAELEQASAHAGLLAVRAVNAGLATTARLGTALRHGLLIVVDGAELRGGSLVLDHICEVAHYLSDLLPINILITGTALGSAEYEIGWRLRRAATVYCLTSVAASQAGPLQEMFGSLPPTRELDIFIAAHSALWLASPVQSAALPNQGLIVVPQGVWAAALPDAAALQAAIGAATARAADAWVVGTHDNALMAMLRRRRNVRTHRVRNFVRHIHATVLRQLEDAASSGVLVLADWARDPAAELAVEVAALLSGEPPQMLVAGDLWSASEVAPALVLDTGASPRHDLLREAFDAAGIPRIALFGTATDRPLASPWVAHGIWASTLRIAEAWSDLPTLRKAARLRAASNLASNSSGWALIWNRMARARADSLAAAARGSG